MANDRQAARRRTREERWRRVRSLRLKVGLFTIVLPFAVFIAFCVCEIGVYSLVQLVPGLSRESAALYGLAVQIAAAIAFVVGGAYVIYSPRNDAWIRRLGRRAPWAPSRQPMSKAKFHARYCAARNRGTAAIFLGFSVMKVFYAWHDLSKPLPSERLPILFAAGLLYSIGVLVYLSLSLTCFRERLALIIGATGLVVWLLIRDAPTITVPHPSAVRELCLFLWASAALVSLALLRSALRAPPPGPPDLQ